MIANFFWNGDDENRKIHWLSWDKMTEVKGKGGLGFRDLEAFNLAMLAKQGWRLLTGEDSLFYKVFKSKYFPISNFLEARVKFSAYWAWQSILASKPVVDKRWRWRVATGSKIAIWDEPWLEDSMLPTILSARPDNINCEIVSQLIDQESNTWNEPFIRAIFNHRDTEQISGLPLSTTNQPDARIWRATPSGKFSVKLAYMIAKQVGQSFQNRNVDGGQTSGSSADKDKWCVLFVV